MSDNTPRSPVPRGYQDLLHSLVLLLAVPLLFFAAIKLVGQTIELPDEQKKKPLYVEIKDELIDTLNQGASPKPPPGEAWQRQITSLETKLEELRKVPNLASDRLVSFKDRLAVFRKHIEQHLKQVPPFTREATPLNAALLRIADEMEQLASSRRTSVSLADWRQEFATFDAEERARFEAAVKPQTKEAAAPLNDHHQADLSKLTRESRDLADQVQSLRDKRLQVVQRAEQEIARLNRRRAFEVDRAEILRLLQPFIARSHSQLGNEPRVWTKVADSQPLSWSKLETWGAMQATTQGLSALAEIGSQLGHYPNQPRPLGSFPPPDGSFMSKPHNIEATKRAQHLLKTHSQTLIEEGWLVP